MLKGLDVLIFDIQDSGCRAYTYPTTLYYAMEEAVKFGIQVIVLDRPNPINGLVVDGPMLKEHWRSFIGYINVPFCHGMTIGELARFFNEQYHIGCDLRVVAMKGWKRSMSLPRYRTRVDPAEPQHARNRYAALFCDDGNYRGARSGEHRDRIYDAL